MRVKNEYYLGSATTYYTLLDNKNYMTKRIDCIFLNATLYSNTMISVDDELQVVLHIILNREDID